MDEESPVALARQALVQAGFSSATATQAVERATAHVGATIELLQMGIQLVVLGQHLGYFPEISVRQHLAEGSLRRLRGLALAAPFELRALTRRDLRPRRSALLLIEEVRALLQEPRPATGQRAEPTRRRRQRPYSPRRPTTPKL